jgi:hypothetical protein
MKSLFFKNLVRIVALFYLFKNISLMSGLIENRWVFIFASANTNILLEPHPTHSWYFFKVSGGQEWCHMPVISATCEAEAGES